MKIKIDGKTCEAQQGEFILDIAKQNDISIPTLCHSDALPGQANCRLCIVEVLEDGKPKTVVSCVYPVTKEIEVITNSDKIMKMRRTIIMLLAARVPDNKYLQELKQEYGVSQPERFHSDPSEECILCGLCVKACEKVGTSAISTVHRGIMKKVSTPYDEPSQPCIGCASCAEVCPTGAIKVFQQGNKRTIWNKKFTLLSCAECGKFFITREQFENVQKRLENSEDVPFCERCKTLHISQKMKDIYGSIQD